MVELSYIRNCSRYNKDICVFHKNGLARKKTPPKNSSIEIASCCESGFYFVGTRTIKKGRKEELSTYILFIHEEKFSYNLTILIPPYNTHPHYTLSNITSPVSITIILLIPPRKPITPGQDYLVAVKEKSQSRKRTRFSFASASSPFSPLHRVPLSILSPFQIYLVRVPNVSPLPHKCVQSPMINDHSLIYVRVEFST